MTLREVLTPDGLRWTVSDGLILLATFRQREDAEAFVTLGIAIRTATRRLP